MPSESILRGPASIVETACPLDCPDACTLAVTVQHGKVIALDGSHRNPVTNGYICAKVRKFDQRLYGPDRLLYPAVRKGRKGEGRFKRTSWSSTRGPPRWRVQQMCIFRSSRAPTSSSLWRSIDICSRTAPPMLRSFA